MRAATTVLAVLAAASLLAACGGSDKQSKSEVVTKANAICRDATAQAREFTSGRDLPANPDEVVVALDEDTRIAKEAAVKLDELDPESTDRDQFDAFVASTKAMAADTTKGSKAAESGTAEQLKAANQATLDEAGAWKQAAKGYGLTNCPFTPVTASFGEQDTSGEDADANSGDNSSDSTDISGDWSGKVLQTGGKKNKRLRYPVDVKVHSTPNGAIGTINYPTLSCRGHLEFVKLQGNFTYVMLERITKNTKNCGGGGNVNLKRNGDRLHYHWTDRVGNGIVVDGNLDPAG